MPSRPAALPLALPPPCRRHQVAASKRGGAAVAVPRSHSYHLRGAGHLFRSADPLLQPAVRPQGRRVHGSALLHPSHRHVAGARRRTAVGGAGRPPRAAAAGLPRASPAAQAPANHRRRPLPTDLQPGPRRQAANVGQLDPDCRVLRDRGAGHHRLHLQGAVAGRCGALRGRLLPPPCRSLPLPPTPASSPASLCLPGRLSSTRRPSRSLLEGGAAGHTSFWTAGPASSARLCANPPPHTQTQRYLALPHACSDPLPTYPLLPLQSCMPPSLLPYFSALSAPACEPSPLVQGRRRAGAPGGSASAGSAGPTSIARSLARRCPHSSPGAGPQSCAGPFERPSRAPSLPRIPSRKAKQPASGQQRQAAPDGGGRCGSAAAGRRRSGAAAWCSAASRRCCAAR